MRWAIAVYVIACVALAGFAFVRCWGIREWLDTMVGQGFIPLTSTETISLGPSLLYRIMHDLTMPQILLPVLGCSIALPFFVMRSGWRQRRRLLVLEIVPVLLFLYMILYLAGLFFPGGGERLL